MAHAQGTPYIVYPSAPDSAILICNFPAAGNPCINPATVYADSAMTQPLNQPISLGRTGQFLFYVAPGANYMAQMSGVRKDQFIIYGGGTGGGGGSPGGATTQFQFNNSGAFGGIPDFTFDGTHTITLGPSGILTINASATVNGITNAMLPNPLTANTSGSAAKLGTARLLAGNSFDGTSDVPFSNKFIVGGTSDSHLTGAQFLGALSTCVLKNTTGAAPNLSCSVAADYPILNQNTTGNAATATAAQSTPSLCTGGQVATGILSNFNATGCTAVLSDPTTTLGDTVYRGPSALTRLAGPTTLDGVPQMLTEQSTGGVAGAPQWGPAGIAINAQTGTTYTVLATDRAGYVTFNNASAITVTLPQAGTTGFANNYTFKACDIGAGTATITPSTSTISYTSGNLGYLSAQTSVSIATGECINIYSDNVNYFANKLNNRGTIANGTAALGTSAISSATCATVVTASAPGVLTTDTIQFTPNASIKAVTGYAPSTSGGLSITAYPTADNVNFDVCNWSSGSITPGAVTLNWRVAR